MRESPTESDTHKPRTTCVGPAALGVLWIFPDFGPLTPIHAKTVVGRSVGCDCALPERGLLTSRRHAEIAPGDGCLHLKDLDTRNGCFVNGKRVSQAPLHSGDLIRLGNWLGLVAEADVSPATFRELAPGVFGSRRLMNVARMLQDMAPTRLPVVLEGPTGTGKEGLARALHGWSGRKGGFHAINCATLTGTLAEAMLFGHTQGAFTGAQRASPGHLQAAHDGTLLLDEFLEMSEQSQAMLLRAVQFGEIIPIGAIKPVKVDARIVVATQTPLDRATAQGKLRQDLWARLDAVRVSIPPLAARREDVGQLFMCFLRDAGCSRPVSPQTVERLCLYNWPRNVRQLELLAQRLAASRQDGGLLPEHVEEALIPLPQGAPAPLTTPEAPVAESDQAMVTALEEALRSSGGQLTKACERLGLSRFQGSRLKRKYPQRLGTNGR